MTSTRRLRGRPKSFHDKKEQNRIQALDRALDVVECLSRANGLTLTEIATLLDQSPATIYRVLSTLEARQFVEVDAASQEWFVGSAAFQTGSSYLRRSDVFERARPFMRELMEETGETANLGTEVNGEVMFLSQVETTASIRAFFPPGSRSPLHASGIGKAILAHAGPAAIEKYVTQKDLAVFTSKTIAGETALRAELEKIKQNGYAFDDEEKNDGMRCVAAPVFNFHGEAVAGISISGPSTRLALERIKSIGETVMKKAALLSG